MPTVWHCDQHTVWYCDQLTVWHCDQPTVWHCDQPTVCHCDQPTVWHCDYLVGEKGAGCFAFHWFLVVVLVFRGVPISFMKMKLANRISDISISYKMHIA